MIGMWKLRCFIALRSLGNLFAEDNLEAYLSLCDFGGLGVRF